MASKLGSDALQLLQNKGGSPLSKSRKFATCSILLLLSLVLGLLYTNFGVGGFNSNGRVDPGPKVAMLEAPAGTIFWYKCGPDTRRGVECGSVIVPLDYFNVSKGKSAIAFARSKAAKSPRKGTLFLNPGGPGASARLMAGDDGYAASIVGPHYDLIGFDPRGIGETFPKVQCFPDPLGREIFVSDTVFEQGFTVSSNLSDPAMRERVITQQREWLAMKKTQAELCAANMGDSLRYMGTATVVRDIEFMTRLFDGEDAPINYWGGSYGSILCAYLVNMFPDRVGRVGIDAIANPVLWAGKPSHFWHRDSVAYTEDTYQIFLNSCSQAGPDLCALAKFAGENPGKIERRIDQFLDKLYDEPLSVPHARRPGVLTAGGVRALMFIHLLSQYYWPSFSKMLSEAMSGNGTLILNKLLLLYSGLPLPDLSYGSDLSRLAVTCLDSPPPETEADYPNAQELADIGLGTLKDVSRHFGMSVSISEPDGGCQFWPVRGPERFVGPWNHTLRNPILIVSNIADPVTPIASGRLLNSLLANSSRLLIVNAPGHGSPPSRCVTRIHREYFTNGTLPPNEFVCEPDELPFPKPGEAIWKSTSMSDDDLHDLEVAREFRNYMFEMKFQH
ncbi:hypothetical protein BD410DRAFT_829026 [Rickenella mellea]|uniref:Alpha/beta-hydrolase n=1 Tax=Rickenella mellea TaxID=50990 RepID=A0A4Y7Q2S4_9AGAM|nr:hypothetical protein BD410DRAFT_829026 [Rickenella mellea]